MFKTTQKLRVIINGVSIYTTAKQIRNGIGDFISVNDSVRCAMESLESYIDRETAAGGSVPVGLGGEWLGHRVQIDKAVY